MTGQSSAGAPTPICPRCEVPLAKRRVTTAGEGWQVEVDVCADSCGGVWLEKEDFQVDLTANLVLNSALQGLNVPAIRGVEPEGVAECPECRTPMEPYRWKHTEVDLDRCATCRGLWFDGREIAAVQQQLKAKGSVTGQAAAAPKPRPNLVMVAVGLALVVGAGFAVKGVMSAKPKAGTTLKGVSTFAAVVSKRTQQEYVQANGKRKAGTRPVYYVKLKYMVMTPEGSRDYVNEEVVQDVNRFNAMTPGGTVKIVYDKANPRTIAIDGEN